MWDLLIERWKVSQRCDGSAEFRTLCEQMLNDPNWIESPYRNGVEERMKTRLASEEALPAERRLISSFLRASDRHWQSLDLLKLYAGIPSRSLLDEGPILFFRLEILLKACASLPALRLSQYLTAIIREDTEAASVQFREYVGDELCKGLTVQFLWSLWLNGKKEAVLCFVEDCSAEQRRLVMNGIMNCNRDFRNFLINAFVAAFLARSSEECIAEDGREVLGLWLESGEKFEKLLKWPVGPRMLVFFAQTALLLSNGGQEGLQSCLKVGHVIHGMICHPGNPHVAEWKDSLARLLEMMADFAFLCTPRVSREYLLSAFAVSPSQERLSRIKRIIDEVSRELAQEKREVDESELIPVRKADARWPPMRPAETDASSGGSSEKWNLLSDADYLALRLQSSYQVEDATTETSLGKVDVSRYGRKCHQSDPHYLSTGFGSYVLTSGQADLRNLLPSQVAPSNHAFGDLIRGGASTALARGLVSLADGCRSSELSLCAVPTLLATKCERRLTSPVHSSGQVPAEEPCVEYEAPDVEMYWDEVFAESKIWDDGIEILPGDIDEFGNIRRRKGKKKPVAPPAPPAEVEVDRSDPWRQLVRLRCTKVVYERRDIILNLDANKRCADVFDDEDVPKRPRRGSERKK
ncbi:unnamed protein product [Notodromas monacha]|uniref:Uncharacterized protein n=1 Tax=Notodromas monacha TaxID=399045 RepID=A0A7R9BHK4_9CRUS|nr:unnamed protein product [Notodromas monacha]CAG0914223.1 unnamed protein product [Notodromas monacha]